MTNSIIPKEKSRFSLKVFLLSALVFGFGFGLGWFWQKDDSGSRDGLVNTFFMSRKSEPGSKLINPLLECELAEGAFTEIRTFDEEIGNLINQITKQNTRVRYLALYFRDLNNGPWFGINEQENFSPASLLKVPLMFAYFKEAEKNPAILKKTYKFENDGRIPPVEQTIVSLETLTVGKSYSVEELIYRMIVYSDNFAQHLLIKNLDLEALKEVFSDFGIALPDESNPNIQISVQDYSRFFRVLFNASYLTRNDSEKALELLSQVKFRDGLVAGVPKDITVAHKFGERQMAGDSEKQVHDCGIVYYPGRPYLICIMSRGDSVPDLIKTISDISRFVYNKLDRQLSGR